MESAEYNIDHIYTPSQSANLPSIEQLEKSISNFDVLIEDCSSRLEEHRKAFMNYSSSIQDVGKKIKTVRDVTEFVKHSDFIENNTCNVDPQLTVGFLKNLRKLLRENRGSEDVILNDLLELAADHGLSIPSIFTDENLASANADTMSLNSLNTIHSEAESEQDVVWDSIKQHLKICLFEKLRQLPIVYVNENMPNMSFISQRRQHYLGSLLMLFDKGEVLEQYQRIRWWHMKNLMDNTTPPTLEVSKDSDNQSCQQIQIQKLKLFFNFVTTCTHEDAAVLMPLLDQHEGLIDWYIRTTYVGKSLGDVDEWLKASLNSYLTSSEEETVMEVSDLEMICDIYGIVSSAVKTVTNMLELCAAADQQSQQKLLVSSATLSKLEPPSNVLARTFKPYIQLMAQALVHYSNITMEQATQAENHQSCSHMTVAVNSSYNLDAHHQPKYIFTGCASLFKIWDKFQPILANDVGKVYVSLRVVLVDVISDKLSLYYQHLWDICRQAMADMSPGPVYLAISTAAFIKNRLLTFDQMLSMDSRLSLLTSIDHYSDLLDSLCELIIEHHKTTITTVILQDADSNNYSNPRAFYEGKRCSFSIQMWNYHLHSIRHDLWQHCPLTLAQRIFTTVLENSLQTLSYRYGQSKPSLRRLNQFRADINSILLMTASFIWYTGQVIESLVHPEHPRISITNTNHIVEVKNIYDYCNCLIMNLAAVACPIETYNEVIPQLSNNATISNSNHVCSTFWLSNFLPNLFSATEISDIPARLSLIIAIKLFRHQPGLDMKLLLQVLYLDKFYTIRLLIKETDLEELYKPIAKIKYEDNINQNVADNQSNRMSIDSSDDYVDSFVDCLLSLTMELDSHCHSKAVYEVLKSLVEKEKDKLSVLIESNVDAISGIYWLQSLNDLLSQWLFNTFMPAISKVHNLHSESDVRTISSTLEKLPCGCPIKKKKTDFDLVLLEALHIALRSLSDNLADIPFSIMEFLSFLQDIYQRLYGQDQPQFKAKIGLKSIRYCVHNFLMQFAVDNPKFDETKCQLFASCILYLLEDNDVEQAKNYLSLHFPYIIYNMHKLNPELKRIDSFFGQSSKSKKEKYNDFGSSFDDLFFASLLDSIEFDFRVTSQIRGIYEFLLFKLMNVEKSFETGFYYFDHDYYENLSERFNPFILYDHIKDWGKIDYVKLTNYNHDWKTLLQHACHLPQNTVKRLLSARPELSESEGLSDTEMAACKEINKHLASMATHSKHGKKK